MPTNKLHLPVAEGKLFRCCKFHPKFNVRSGSWTDWWRMGKEEGEAGRGRVGGSKRKRKRRREIEFERLISLKWKLNSVRCLSWPPHRVIIAIADSIGLRSLMEILESNNNEPASINQPMIMRSDWKLGHYPEPECGYNPINKQVGWRKRNCSGGGREENQNWKIHINKKKKWGKERKIKKKPGTNVFDVANCTTRVFTFSGGTKARGPFQSAGEGRIQTRVNAAKGCSLEGINRKPGTILTFQGGFVFFFSFFLFLSLSLSLSLSSSFFFPFLEEEKKKKKKKRNVSCWRRATSSLLAGCSDSALVLTSASSGCWFIGSTSSSME